MILMMQFGDGMLMELTRSLTSPDGKKVYISFWGEATWKLERKDGLRFDDAKACVNYDHGVGLDE